MNSTDSQTQTTQAHIRLLARVSSLYYDGGLTQEEIGRQLGFSRVKISRMLQQARELGVVEIKINTPHDVYVELQQALCTMYGLRDAIVVSTSYPKEARYMALAQGAAEWLHLRLQDNLIIGLGQGRTISYIPRVFATDRQVDCTFAEVVGGASNTPSGFANYNITSKMAEIVGGRASYIYAPTIVSSDEIRDALLRENSIAQALQLARQADIIIQSVGPVDQSALLYIHGFLDDADLAQLQDLNAVGDTLSQFFDEYGQCVAHPICSRVVGLTLDDLRQIPYSVAVAGGDEKVAPLRAAMRGCLINILITDLETAKALL